MTTDTDTYKLWDLLPGHVFTLSGTEYVLVQFSRTRAKIARVSDKKMFVLKMEATVRATVPPTRDEDTLSAVLTALSERQDARPQLTLRAGTKVKFVDLPQTRKAGLVGQETVITKVNTKTYGLANGYNVGPSMVEAIQ